MNVQPTPQVSAGSVSALREVQLTTDFAAIIESAQSNCGGSVLWRRRKSAEISDFCRLAQLSGRLQLLHLDVGADLRIDLLMRVTVPCLPQPNGPLAIAQTARVGIVYREAALVTPQPGYSFVQILAPRPVWHPNVSWDGNQALCLGPSLPAGIPLREIVLMVYGALTLVSVQLDPANSAGVLNPAAADWFQRNPGLIPLSREPFVQPSTRIE